MEKKKRIKLHKVKKHWVAIGVTTLGLGLAGTAQADELAPAPVAPDANAISTTDSQVSPLAVETTTETDQTHATSEPLATATTEATATSEPVTAMPEPSMTMASEQAAPQELAVSQTAELASTTEETQAETPVAPAPTAPVDTQEEQSQVSQTVATTPQASQWTADQISQLDRASNSIDSRESTQGLAANQGWQEVDGNFYFITSQNKRATDWTVIDDGIYYFDKSGAQVKGQFIPVTNTASNYTLKDSGKKAFGVFENDGKLYYADMLNGVVLKDANQAVVYQGKVYHADAATGELSVTSDKVTYRDSEGNEATSGFVTADDGSKYYLSLETNQPVVGRQVIDGQTYYFYNDGRLAINARITETVDGQEKEFIYGGDGQLLKNTRYIGNLLTRNHDGQPTQKNPYPYHQAWGVSAEGTPVDYNSVSLDETTYTGYQDPAQKSPVLYLRKNMFDKDGDHTYYFGSDGRKVVDAFAQIDANWYYFGYHGRMATGLQTIDGMTYYFGQDGKQYKGQSFELDGKTYTTDVNSGQVSLASESQDSQPAAQQASSFPAPQSRQPEVVRAAPVASIYHTHTYQTKDLAPTSGWQALDGKVYFLDNYNQKLSDWTQIDQKWYYFDQTGALVTNGFVEAQDHSGRLLYMDGATAQPVTGLKDIDGSRFYFTSEGYLALGEDQDLTIDGQTYHINGQTGQAQLAGQSGLDTAQAAKLIADSLTSYPHTTASSNRFVTANLLPFQGWKTADGKTYFITDKNSLIKNWASIDGGWYFFDENGVQLKGQRVPRKGASKDNRESYVDATTGQLVHGLQEVDGKSYYFGPNGFLVTNQVVIADGKVYQLAPSTGEATQIADHVTYRDIHGNEANAGFVTGDDGNWRYLSPETGQPLTGHQVIDGISYYFFEDGRQAKGVAVREIIDGQEKISYYAPYNGEWLTNTMSAGVFTLVNPDGTAVDLDNQYVSRTLYFDAQGNASTDGNISADETKYMGYAIGKNFPQLRKNLLYHSGDKTYYFRQSDGKKVVNDFAYLDHTDQYGTGVSYWGGQTAEDGWYYFGDQGKMVTGLQTINGKTYYFGDNGKQYKGQSFVLDGKTYTTDANSGEVSAL